MTTQAALTKGQLDLLAARRRDIRRLLHERFQSWAYNRVREDGSNTAGGQMDNRQIGLGKIAIFDSGRYILSHWATIEPELVIDPLLHAKYMLGNSGTLLLAWNQADLQNRFYSTVKSGDAVDAFGGWSCARVDAIPNFGSVSRDDVWEWLGYTGGTTGEVAVVSLTPGMPTDFTATPNGPTRITLSWEAPLEIGGSAITGYRIEHAIDDPQTFVDLVANTGNTNLTYMHTRLAPGSDHWYRVSAINSAGVGLPSVIVKGTTAS